MNLHLLHFKKETKALFLMLIGGVLVGAAPALAKMINEPASTIVFYRILMAFPFFFLSNKFERRIPPAKELLLLIAAGILFALDMSAFYLSLKFTSVATATLLANFSPIYITAYSIFFKKKITQEFFWVLFAVIGLLLLCGVKHGHVHNQFFGDLIALVSAFFFTGHIFLVNRLGTQYSSIDIMFWSSIGAMALLIFLCLSFKINMQILTYHDFLLLILMALGSQAIGQTCLTSSITTFSPAFSSLSILIDPIAAAIFAFLLLGESLNTVEKIGGAIILISIFGAYKSTTLHHQEGFIR